MSEPAQADHFYLIATSDKTEEQIQLQAEPRQGRIN